MRLSCGAVMQVTGFDLVLVNSKIAVVAQLVEHVIGNDEVSSSILLNGSDFVCHLSSVGRAPLS